MLWRVCCFEFALVIAGKEGCLVQYSVCYSVLTSLSCLRGLVDPGRRSSGQAASLISVLAKFDVKGKQSGSDYCQTFNLMEVNEAKVDLFGHQPVESEVKLEPSEDIKSLDPIIEDIGVLTSASVWTFLVKRSRYLHQVEHGRTPICPSVQTKLTVTLLREMQQLLR